MLFRSGTNALSGVVPAFFRRLFETTRAGDVATAQQMQFQLLGLFEAIINPFEFPLGVRAAVAQRGFQIGDSRQPIGNQQRQALAKILESMAPSLTAMGYDDLEMFRCN